MQRTVSVAEKAIGARRTADSQTRAGDGVWQLIRCAAGGAVDARYEALLVVIGRAVSSKARVDVTLRGLPFVPLALRISGHCGGMSSRLSIQARGRALRERHALERRCAGPGAAC